MCMRVDCRQCGKPTWSGCGKHIEQALAGVPAKDRCRCREEKAAQKSGEPARGGFWSLFSKTPQR